MLSKEDEMMLQHFLNQGLPKKAIADRLGINRKTVQRHAIKKPIRGKRADRKLIIDEYKEYIKGRLEMYPELSAVRLLYEIIKMGYKGKYTTVKDYVRQIRPKTPLEIEQRFEMPPGWQAQVDFATFKTSFGTVYALLVVMSWSRLLWIRFYMHQDQLTVLGGLHQAFQVFGGVPQTVLFDRMKAAVARSDDRGRAVFNDEMMRFAIHCGFRPAACRPYRAKTKGKVERAVSYLRQSFFYGREFHDLEDLNRQLQGWLDIANSRMHGTTGEVPAQRFAREKTSLSPLPQAVYVPLVTVGRRISRDGYISYNGNDYSIPEGLIKSEVTVSAGLQEVRLYQDSKLVAVHPLLEGTGGRRLDPHHHRKNKIENRPTGSDLYPSGDFVEVQRRSLEVYEGVLR
jgi:transposase